MNWYVYVKNTQCSVCTRFFFLNIFCSALLSGLLSFEIHSHGMDLWFHLKLMEGHVSFRDWWGREERACFNGGGNNSRLEQTSDMGLTANLRNFLDWFVFQKYMTVQQRVESKVQLTKNKLSTGCNHITGEIFNDSGAVWQPPNHLQVRWMAFWGHQSGRTRKSIESHLTKLCSSVINRKLRCHPGLDEKNTF